MKIASKNMLELSAQQPFEQGKVHKKSYGKFLEDFETGKVFEHPRGMTLTSGFLHYFSTTFLEANPLYLNREYARSLGHPEIPANPLLVFNIVLSLGVQNNSEKAYANLGYYNMHFLKPVYAGDTLRAFSLIADRKDRGPGKPGIVTLNTIGLNQKNERVIQYTRKIMVPPRPEGYEPPESLTSDQQIPPFTNEVELELPEFSHDKVPSTYTRTDTYYEDFKVGDTIISPNGRTITDEHFALTYNVGNTHPLHFDKLYSQSLSGAMSGEPIVYGGLVFAWLSGLASRDISENAYWDLGYTEGYHTQPSKSGETVTVLHRVLAKEEPLPGIRAGAIQFQMIGLKDIRASDALDKFGADLFIKENDKKAMNKEKISNKIFEIERKLLIRCKK